MSTLAFDSASIQARIVANAQTLMEADGYAGATFLFTGTNMRLIQAVSEELADDVLYDEQLTREVTWSLAQNISSIMAQVAFYNYIPHRMVGAQGSIRVSSSSTFSGSHALPIPIARWNSFSGGGYTFTCSGDPKNSYNDYSLNAQSEYIDVAVIQGLPKSITYEITSAAYTAPGYISLKIDLSTVENTMIDVYVNGQKWSSISNLRLASSSSSLVYRIRNASNLSCVYIDFGNNIFGKSLQYGDVVKIRYLDTSGASGDISSSGVVTSVNDTYYDSSDNVVKMYCTNIEAISGGDTYEDIESIRAAAPQLYKNSGVVITADNYESTIESASIVDRVMVWGEAEENEDLGNSPGTYLSSQENVVHITGFNVDSSTKLGVVITSAEQTLIRNALSSVKGTTDIVQFIDTLFIYLIFTVKVYISDTKYVPSAVEATVYDALQTQYALSSMGYYTDLYASKYKAFIDKQAGVDHHITSLQLAVLVKFTSAYEFTVNMYLAGIVSGSVKLYIKGGEFSDWTLLAHDVVVSSTVGNITGDTIPSDPTATFQIPNATIQYATGVIGSLVVTSGLTSAYSLYTVRVLFNLTPATGIDVDVLLTKRQQIIGFYDATVSAVQM
jgi:hypothetical protein